MGLKEKKEGISGENTHKNSGGWVSSYSKGPRGRWPALSEVFILRNKGKIWLER